MWRSLKLTGVKLTAVDFGSGTATESGLIATLCTERTHCHSPSLPCEGDGRFLLQPTDSGVDKRSQAFHLLSSLTKTILHLTHV